MPAYGAPNGWPRQRRLTPEPLSLVGDAQRPGARSSQGRASCARRSEPLTASTTGPASTERERGEYPGPGTRPPPRAESEVEGATSVHRIPLTPLPARPYGIARPSPGAFSRAPSGAESFGLSRPRLASSNPAVGRSHQPSIRCGYHPTMILSSISPPGAGRPGTQSKSRWTCVHQGPRRATWHANRRHCLSSPLGSPLVHFLPLG